MSTMTQPRVQELPDIVDLLGLHRCNPARYPFLLESTTAPSVQGGVNSRYDILFAFPVASLHLDDAGLQGHNFAIQGKDFLANLDRWHAAECETRKSDDGKIRSFTGGWFIYLGYELATQIEPTLRLPKIANGLPIALAVRCTGMIIRDHASGKVSLLTDDGSAVQLAQMQEDIRSCAKMIQPDCEPPSHLDIVEDSPARFINSVEQIKEYIRAGDVFQVNLSREWNIGLHPEADWAELYRRLRRANPAPFSGLMRWGERAIISSSPERLVCVDRQRVHTRPIAGTRPRLGGIDADMREGQMLLQHPKERAEHIMLIDLERNDLGRICEPGSVNVDELMTIESYSHVHHIVSNVSGNLRNGVGPGGVIRAVFPGGTITGCPKIRCMEIIAELEEQGRGAYTGSMGYLGLDGYLDLNILIRSMTWQPGSVNFRTGAGIVADSIPDLELEETRAKARGLLRVFGADA